MARKSFFHVSFRAPRPRPQFNQFYYFGWRRRFRPIVIVACEPYKHTTRSSCVVYLNLIEAWTTHKEQCKSLESCAKRVPSAIQETRRKTEWGKNAWTKKQREGDSKHKHIQISQNERMVGKNERSNGHKRARGTQQKLRLETISHKFWNGSHNTNCGTWHAHHRQQQQRQCPTTTAMPANKTIAKQRKPEYFCNQMKSVSCVFIIIYTQHIFINVMWNLGGGARGGRRKEEGTREKKNSSLY